MGARAHTGPAQLRAQGFHAGETDTERLCGLPQVTQRGWGAGLDPGLPLSLLPSSWGSDAGCLACVAHHASWGAGRVSLLFGPQFPFLCTQSPYNSEVVDSWPSGTLLPPWWCSWVLQTLGSGFHQEGRHGPGGSRYQDRSSGKEREALRDFTLLEESRGTTDPVTSPYPWGVIPPLQRPYPWAQNARNTHTLGTQNDDLRNSELCRPAVKFIRLLHKRLPNACQGQAPF